MLGVGGGRSGGGRSVTDSTLYIRDIRTLSSDASVPTVSVEIFASRSSRNWRRSVDGRIGETRGRNIVSSQRSGIASRMPG